MIENLERTGYPDGKIPPHILCGNCGAMLFEDDVYYPELGVCEHCVALYEKRIEWEELHDSRRVAW